MIKISIITPVYNEAKSLGAYFEAIQKIDYPKEKYELILINDGSSDNTREKLRQAKNQLDIAVKLIDLPKNKGRIWARVTGAKEAQSDNLLFIDSRCEIFPDCLKQVNSLNYQPIVGKAIQKENNIFDRFFYLIRSRLFKNSYEGDFADLFITEKNFDSISKGTTIFFCDKNLFLESQVTDINNKARSDDIKFLKNIVSRKKILKTAKVREYYNTRQTLGENMVHLYHRGPRFVDYYYAPNKIHFWIINLILLAVFWEIFFAGIGYWYLGILVFVSLNFIISLFFIKKVKDFFIFFFLLPVLLSAFMVGVVWGIFIKLFNIKKRTLSIAASLAALFLVGIYIYNHQNIIDTTKSINFFYLPLLIFFYALMVFFNGLMLKNLIEPFGIKLKKHFALSGAISFYNLVTPFRGGAGFRALYLKKIHNLSYSDFASSFFGNYIVIFFINSMAGVLVLLGIYWKYKIFNVYFFIIFLIMAASTIWLSKANFYFKRKNFLFKKINKIIAGWEQISLNKNLIKKLYSYTLGILFINALIIDYVFTAIGSPIDFLQSLYLSVISTLAILINITPGSFGVTEALFTISTSVTGLAPETMLLASLLQRAVQFMALLFIGVWANFFLFKNDKK